jgi:putative flippase GtrA
MSFYYGSNKSDGPEDKPSGFKETLQIIWVVFRVLAMPVGVLLGVVLALVLLFYLFTLTPYLGLAAIAAIVVAVVARGIWEARHPPEIR